MMVNAHRKAHPELTDDEIVSLWFDREGPNSEASQKAILLDQVRSSHRELKAKARHGIKYEGYRITGELLRQLKINLAGRMLAKVERDFHMTPKQAMMYLQRCGVYNRRGKLAKELWDALPGTEGEFEPMKAATSTNMLFGIWNAFGADAINRGAEGMMA